MKVKTMARLARLMGQKKLVEKYTQSSASLYERIQIEYGDADISLDMKELSFEWKVPSWVMAHQDVAHGGMIAVVFDTMMGILAMARSIPRGRVAFTKTLSIEYHTKLETRGRALVHVWVKEAHGQRLVISASMRDHRDILTSSAEGIFVSKSVKKAA